MPALDEAGVVKLIDKVAKATKLNWMDLQRELLQDPAGFAVRYKKYLGQAERDSLVKP